MKIAIIGLGYVGLPLACAIDLKTSHEVVGYDYHSQKIGKIRNRQCPIDDFQCSEDLKITKFIVSDKADIMTDSDIFIICVPTPVLNDYTPDLTPLKSGVEAVLPYIKKGCYVVVESTINPGVCDEIVIPMIEDSIDLKAGIDFDVAHCPERINPGDQFWNVYNIPRNIGSTRPEATKVLADFYRSFISGEINEMPNLKTVEATKIIENTFRDINIAFVNELAKSFDVLNIDLMAVIKGASNKPFAFLPHFPGCGVGGHCIPVDPYYLIERAKQSGFDHKLLKLAREINNSMPEYTVEKLTDALNILERPIKNTPIALLGLSYKANVGDLRESPSVILKSILLEKQAATFVYDPFFPEHSNVESLEKALENSYAVVLATDHNIFKEKLTPEFLLKYNIRIVIDGKNCLDKENIIKAGILYKGIGT